MSGSKPGFHHHPLADGAPAYNYGGATPTWLVVVMRHLLREPRHLRLIATEIIAGRKPVICPMCFKMHVVGHEVRRNIKAQFCSEKCRAIHDLRKKASNALRTLSRLGVQLPPELVDAKVAQMQLVRSVKRKGRKTL